MTATVPLSVVKGHPASLVCDCAQYSTRVAFALSLGWLHAWRFRHEYAQSGMLLPGDAVDLRFVDSYNHINTHNSEQSKSTETAHNQQCHRDTTTIVPPVGSDSS